MYYKYIVPYEMDVLVPFEMLFNFVKLGYRDTLRWVYLIGWKFQNNISALSYIQFFEMFAFSCIC